MTTSSTKSPTARGKGKALVALGLASALALAACGTSSTAGDAEADDAQITLRWASPNPETASQEVEVSAWMDFVQEETNGRVEFETFYTGSLFPATEALAAMKDGRTDMATVFQSYWPAEFPLFQSAGLPFQTPANYDPFADNESWWRLLQENEAFSSEIAAQDIRIVAFVGLSASVLATSEPVDGLGGLDGLIVREPGLHGHAYDAVGAQATALNPGEIYESIQRGVIDGVAYPFSTMDSMSFPEVAPHITDHGLGAYGIYAVGIGEETWAELPSDIQTAILKATDRYFAERDRSILRDADMATCDAVLAAGGSAQRLADDEYEAWKEKAKNPTFQGWLDHVESQGGSKEIAEQMHERRMAIYEEIADPDYVSPVAECSEKN